NSGLAMLAVFAVLMAGSLITWRLRAKHPDKDYKELVLRVRSWWVMIAVVFTALVVSDTAAIVLFAVISFLALKEFFSIVPTRLTDRRAVFWSYVAIPIQYYWVASGWYGMFIIFIPVYLFLFLPMRMVLTGDTKGFIRSAGTLHWAS